MTEQDSNTDDTAIQQDKIHQEVSVEDRRWIEGNLRKCRFVDWDRFTVAYQSDWPGPVVTVYGWIEREDAHEDFVHLVFYTAEQNIDFTTSSDEFSERIHEVLIDEPAREHNPCKRVERHFNVQNAVVLDD